MFGWPFYGTFDFIFNPYLQVGVAFWAGWCVAICAAHYFGDGHTEERG